MHRQQPPASALRHRGPSLLGRRLLVAIFVVIVVVAVGHMSIAVENAHANPSVAANVKQLERSPSSASFLSMRNRARAFGKPFVTKLPAQGTAASQEGAVDGAWMLVPRSLMTRYHSRFANTSVCLPAHNEQVVDLFGHVDGCVWNVFHNLSRAVPAARSVSRIGRLDDHLWHIPSFNGDVIIALTSIIPSHAAVFRGLLPPSLKPSTLEAVNAVEYSGGSFVHPSECVRSGWASSHGAASTVLQPWVVFVGHSHGRMLACMLCMLLQLPDCERFRKMVNTETNLSSTEEDVLTFRGATGLFPAAGIGFVKSSYDVRDRMSAVSALLHRAFAAMTKTSTESHSVPLSGSAVVPRLVVYQRGPWDLVFMDTPMYVFVEEMAAGIVALHDALHPETILVVYLTHYTQPLRGAASPTARDWRHNLRNVCLHRDRVLRLRNATVCAIKHAVSKRPALLERLGLFDVWAEAESLPLQEKWQRFVDWGGHHYLDVVLEAMAMKFLRHHVCSNATASRRALVEAYLSSVSAETCDAFVAEGAVGAPRKLACSCHNKEWRDEGLCSSMLGPLTAPKRSKAPPPTRKRHSFMFIGGGVSVSH